MKHVLTELNRDQMRRDQRAEGTALLFMVALNVAIIAVILWAWATGTPDLSAVFDTTPSV